jgi:hypothetical protein
MFRIKFVEKIKKLVSLVTFSKIRAVCKTILTNCFGSRGDADDSMAACCKLDK